MRLAVLTSHPIQYHAPLFREIAEQVDMTVFFAHKISPEQHAAAGFGTAFDWDIDLLSGHPHMFLRNVARDPGIHHFAGCDTPEFGERLAAGGFGALLVTGWHLKSYWQGIWAAKRHRIPVIVRGDSQLNTPRSLAKRSIKHGVYPPLLRLFDAAVYVGQRNREYYEHYSYPLDRLFHSPHCIDTARFVAGATLEARMALRMELGIRMDEKAVLFAGKLLPIKRPLDIVEAVARIRAQGLPVHCIVAGSGMLELEMRARAQALEVPVHFLGFRNQTQMPGAYAAADVLSLPSDSESWGLVCNEALACGTPIVVSDAVGCAPDLTSDSAAGVSFPVGNVSALSGALARLLEAPPGAEAIRRVSDDHSLEAATVGIVAALNSVAQAKESRV